LLGAVLFVTAGQRFESAHRLQVRRGKHRDIDVDRGLVHVAFNYVVRGGQGVRKDTKTHQDRWRDDAYLSSNDPAHSRTIRKWIRHRAETRIAAADAYRIRRQIRAATCGLRWTTADAARIRDTAAALNPDHSSLAEIMRITRHYSSWQSACA